MEKPVPIEQGDHEEDFETPKIDQFLGFKCCRTVNYKFLNIIDEGSYGVSSRAKCNQSGEIVCLKKLKLEGRDFLKDGFPLTFIRELKTLNSLSHENIVQLREVVIGSTFEKIYLVFDYIEHTLYDMYAAMKKFPLSEVKYYFYEILKGVDYLHRNNIVHRDLKTSNILVGGRGVVKICDFGLSRKSVGDGKEPKTPLVCTLWYRPPELLFSKENYSFEVDIWGVGCIFYELLSTSLQLPGDRILFRGEDEIDQLQKTFRVLGRPNERRHKEIYSLMNKSGFVFKGPEGNCMYKKFEGVECGTAVDLLKNLVCLEPSDRITAAEALKHPFFFEKPRMKNKILLQSLPSTNKQSVHEKKRKRVEEKVFMDELEMAKKKRKKKPKN